MFFFFRAGLLAELGLETVLDRRLVDTAVMELIEPSEDRRGSPDEEEENDADDADAEGLE